MIVHAFDETSEERRARRAATRVMVGVLQDDLYERVADEDPDSGMTWQSPLGHRCRISLPGPRVEVWDSRGSLLADYVAVDGYELDAVLP